MTEARYTILDRITIPDYDSMKQMQTGNLDIDPGRCRECGTCVIVCPGGCLLTDTATKIDLVTGRVKGGTYGLPRLDRMKSGATLCVACFDCGAACPYGAISIERNFNPGRYFKRITQDGEMRYPKRY